MPVQIACPKCGASYNVADERLGRIGRCKKCGHEFPLVPQTRAHLGAEASFSRTDLDSIPRATEAVLPDSFGRYKVLKLLGRGGMGSVYLARDIQLNREVALKVPHIHAFADRPDVRERFFREAQAAARFHHPNFCPIFDIGEVDGVPYLTMAFIHGETLSASIDHETGWPPRRAVEVVRELALALARAHREGIVHRDLKPANIMVDTEGRMILMDFGLARWYDDVDSTFTPTGAILGTPAYMPPEQAEGNIKAIGPRSDLYSLGVILYELLTGHRPFEGPITKVLGMIAFVEPTPPSTLRPGLDPRIEAICLKAMAKKIDDRYASMDEFAGVLADLLTQEAAPSSGPFKKKAESKLADPVGPPPVEPSRDGSEDGSTPPRSPILIGVAAAAFVVLLFGLIVYVVTDKGRIKIEVDDPKVVVLVDAKVDPPPPDQTKQPVVDTPAPPPVDQTLITNTLGMKLALIPAGEFDMGSDNGDSDEKPVHRVKITRPFYLGTTELTQGQYRAVTGANPSRFRETDDLPVEQVSWLDAIRFCDALSLKEGLTPFYRVEGDKVSVPDWKGPGYRLPTEAEWEYASRAGPGGMGAYGFGDDATQLDRHAWYAANSESKTHPVGRKAPNGWGLFDMHGNVYEWCWDVNAAYEAGSVVDPIGPRDGSNRVIRGGGWGGAAGRCRAAYRSGRWDG